eukprot:5172204-Amphidinium_carterae.1
MFGFPHSHVSIFILSVGLQIGFEEKRLPCEQIANFHICKALGSRVTACDPDRSYLLPTQCGRLWDKLIFELNLATDLRYEGKGARPESHACRQRGSREVPLAKCVCCENWACSRHYL